MRGKASEQSVALTSQRAWLVAPIRLAAALPVARNRGDHFTTLATLTR
jgi:hypothetical protein